MKPIVLDTCVLISGLLKPFGASGALVDAFFRDRLKLAWTSDIVAEYGEVMARDEFDIESRERVAVVLKLRSCGEKVTPCPVPDAEWPDVDDLPFVAAALAVESRTIVTLNPRDVAPALDLGIRIVKPGEALQELRE